MKNEVWDMIEKGIPLRAEEYAPEDEHAEDWDLAGLRANLMVDMFLDAKRLPKENEGTAFFASRDELDEYLVGVARDAWHSKLDEFGPNTDAVLRFVVLSTIDEKWKDHLYDLDHLKASIGFRGWGQGPAGRVQEGSIRHVRRPDDRRPYVGGQAGAAGAARPAMPPPELFAPMPPTPQPDENGAGRRTGPTLGVNPLAAVRSTPRPEPMQTNQGEACVPRPVSAAKEVGRNDPAPAAAVRSTNSATARRMQTRAGRLHCKRVAGGGPAARAAERYGPRALAPRELLALLIETGLPAVAGRPAAPLWTWRAIRSGPSIRETDNPVCDADDRIRQGSLRGSRDRSRQGSQDPGGARPRPPCRGRSPPGTRPDVEPTRRV